VEGMRPAPLLRLIAAGALAATFTACGGHAHASALAANATAATPAATGAATVAPSTAARADGTTPITKAIVFVVENHSLAEMRDGMPRTYAFAREHAYASAYHANRHPSLPNYVAIAAGTTFGIADDADPAAHPLRGDNVFRQAVRRGRTVTTYADAMPGRCTLTNSGSYAVRHNPWTYFVKDRAACRRHDVPVRRHLAHDARTGTLPDLGFVIPDVQHDAHDGTLAQADAWIGARIATLTAGPDWRSGRLAIVVTADEDDRSAGNRVLTVVATHGQRPRVVRTPLDHYSLTGFLEDVIGARHLRHARTAPSLARAFHLTTR